VGGGAGSEEGDGLMVGERGRWKRRHRVDEEKCQVSVMGERSEVERKKERKRGMEV